jgi:putative PIN family toxin of toxin-antitoxin system
MLKVVIDTNIIVSALLKTQSNPALIISIILRRNYKLCLSEEIFSEFEEVLARDKFKHLDRLKVKELLSTLKKNSLWVVPKISVNDVAKDPADNAFLECALETGADFLITGNIHHFPVKQFHQTRIVSPGEFLDLITKLNKIG